MKKLVAMLLMCVAMQASALELGGVKLEDKVQVGNAPLVLNGAGVRSALFFDVYAAGLYLAEKKTSAEAVMADEGAKRIVLYVLKDGDARHFLDSLRKGIGKNQSEQQLAALGERMDALNHLFEGIEKVKKTDAIAFDWLPGVGTRISLNDKELGRIEGADFYRALLSIWIGDKPARADLKKELLGA